MGAARKHLTAHADQRSPVDLRRLTQDTSEQRPASAQSCPPGSCCRIWQCPRQIRWHLHRRGEQKRLCKRKRYAQAVSVGVGIYEKVRAHPLLTRFSSDLNVIQADAAVHLDVEERKALAQQPNLHRQPVLHIRGRVSTPGSQAAIPYRARSSAREVDRCKHRSRTMHWTEPLVRLALALAPPPFVVPSPTFGIISGMNF